MCSIEQPNWHIIIEETVVKGCESRLGSSRHRVRCAATLNGFSKKVENHAASVALHFLYMNFGRPHTSHANPYPRTPAMAAGLADHVWTCEEIAALLD